MVCELVCGTTRYSIRHKQETRKVTAVELADTKDTDGVDSKEEQDTSVDNTCYMKLASKLTLYQPMTPFGVIRFWPHVISWRNPF